MIVSCGEALIDFIPHRHADGSLAFRPHPGGSPFNVAIALGRLSVEAGFFGGLSTDFFGTMLRDALDDCAVDSEFAVISRRPSTLAFVDLDEGEARYAFFDEGSAGRMLTEADLPAFPREVTALHFGSISLAEEPCGSTLEELMHREQRDRVISLDPNVRPPLIRNRDGYVARIERMAAMSDIVKLSDDDLAWLAPGVAFETVARRWFAHATRLAVLTKGAAGATALARNASVEVPGVAIETVDTVGAGDTLTAALLARLAQRQRLGKAALADLTADELTDALGFAVKAAAITASRAGADPPWLSELASAA